MLGFLPGDGPDGRGWFQGAQSGAPVLELTLTASDVLSITLAPQGLVGLAGLARGDRLGRVARRREDGPA